jgi:serine/threonine protein kinase
MEAAAFGKSSLMCSVEFYAILLEDLVPDMLLRDIKDKADHVPISLPPSSSQPATALLIAFNQLKIEKELGKGAYGTIYKAILPPRTDDVAGDSDVGNKSNEAELSQKTTTASAVSEVVAVKQITTTSREEIVTAFNDWRHEVLLMRYVCVCVVCLGRQPTSCTYVRLTHVYFYSSIQHANVVNFLGFCIEPQCIVMEFISGGALSDFLARHRGQQQQQQQPVLGWGLVLQLAVDIADAMNYLHHTCNPPIIHRDLKTPNILV